MSNDNRPNSQSNGLNKIHYLSLLRFGWVQETDKQINPCHKPIEDYTTWPIPCTRGEILTQNGRFCLVEM